MDDLSTSAYVRQAVRGLHAVLPPNSFVIECTAVALSDELAAISESVELERALAEAACLRGTERLAPTLDPRPAWT